MRLSTNRKLPAQCLAIAVGAFALPAFGAAIIIPVTNGSFEQPDVLNLTNGYPTNQNAAGGAQTKYTYTEQLATSSSPYYYGPNNVNDPIPYWSVVSTNNSGKVYGICNPDSTRFYGASGGTNGLYNLPNNTDYTFNSLASINSSYGYGYADGYQTAYANLAPGASVSLTYFPSDPNTGDPAGTGQSLGNFIPGDTYSLTVGIGTPLTSSAAFNYSIILLDNGTPVASSSTNASPAMSTWVQTAVPFTAVDSGAIGIELIATDPNSAAALANFDNVQLVDLGPGNAPISPEPASLGVLALGFLGFRRGCRG